MTSASTPRRAEDPEQVAVVGMAGVFPAAPDVPAFWENLCAGVDGVARFTPQELLDAGCPSALVARSDYVPRKGHLPGADRFDAAFFEMSPAEAEIVDPQHRVFLEVAWHAMEDAAIDPDRFDGDIGVYGGCGSTWYQDHCLHGRMTEGLMDRLQLRLGNDREFLTTRVAYKLGLTGPAVTVATACSTSLVAVHLAGQALLDGECDVALAGGVSVTVPLVAGYLHEPGSIAAADGVCRPFDAAASGTVGGDGAGVVVLRRLSDALRDGHRVRAVVAGSAVNNDGRGKLGFTAPSPEAQRSVIREAMAVAGIGARDVGFVETHGTGTRLGDAVELTALRDAHGADDTDLPPCALGAVKANIGHLDAAAGIASLIKAVLVVETGLVPPTLHFEEAAPDLALETSRFCLPRALAPWPSDEAHHAGVSSFGMGGTNVHVILGPAPDRRPPEGDPAARPDSVAGRHHVVPLSARTERALIVLRQDTADAIDQAGPDLAAVARTLQRGRARHPWRCAVVAADPREAADALRDAPMSSGRRRAPRGGVVALLPGQGAQRVGLGQGIYRCSPEVRRWVDRGAEILATTRPDDLRSVMFGDPARLATTAWTQPALFVLEYGLARLLERLGLRVDAYAGHSVGEIVAATLSGVLDFDDAVRLTERRSRLMDDMPPGAMTAVGGPPAVAQDVCREGETWVGAVNGDDAWTLTGTVPGIERAEAELAARRLPFRRLPVGHAFHSPLAEPVAQRLGQVMASMELQPPRRRFVSNLSGQWAGDEVASVEYWVRQLCSPVVFGPALDRLVALDPAALVELGRPTLGPRSARQTGIPGCALLPASAGADEHHAVLRGLATAWVEGADVERFDLDPEDGLALVSLPGYPFERVRHWAVDRSGPTGPARRATGDTAAEVVGVVDRRPPDDERHELRHRLGRMWLELLGVAPVDGDDFFALGGDSLLATRLTTMIRSELGIDVGVEAVFEAPTLAAMAGLVERRSIAVVDTMTGHDVDRVRREDR